MKFDIYRYGQKNFKNLFALFKFFVILRISLFAKSNDE